MLTALHHNIHCIAGWKGLHICSTFCGYSREISGNIMLNVLHHPTPLRATVAHFNTGVTDIDFGMLHVSLLNASTTRKR